MKKLVIRFLAGLLASVLLVTAVALIGNMPNGKRTDGIFYESSGIHPDAVLLTVNNYPVSAEEYLYWLAYDCDYLSSTMGQIDFDTAIATGMTYGDYVMSDAQKSVTLYAIVRAWAEKAGISLSDEDEQQLTAQRQQYVDYYGGEEGYAAQLKVMGLSDESFQEVNRVYYLYAALFGAYCNADGALHPTDEEINAYAVANSMVTVRPLYWSVSGDAETDAAALAQAEDFAAQLQAASDKDATYISLAQQLAIEASDASETVSTASLDPKLAAAISELGEEQSGDVVITDSYYYVMLRKKLDVSTLLQIMFSNKMDELRENASVKYNSRYYDKLNVSSFYTKLTTARTALSASAGDDQAS